MKKILFSAVLALLLMFSTTPVYAVPALPHAFYGNVTIDGSAPDEILVSATVTNGDVLTNSQNPVVAAEDSYGISSPRLLVQGDGLGGAITFYVNGVEASSDPVIVDFEVGGGPTEVALFVTIEPEEPEPEPEPEPSKPYTPPPPKIETTIFGIEESFSISDEGEILEEIVATSEDENVTMTIPEGTIALDIEGEPLETLEAAVDPSPPEPPEDAYLIGAYDFGPDGATFDPPITLTWSYDPETLPEDVDLVIAYYDEISEEWVWVTCEVDTVNNIITASVAHFTTFAIIAVPVELPPVIVPPVGEEEEEEEEPVGEQEEEEEEPVGEQEEEEEEPVGEQEEEEEEPVGEQEEEEEIIAPPAKPGTNWALIGGIIAAVIAAGLLIYFLVFRRRAY